jgi:predicted DNA-binding ribbon-helix-helix protein
MESEQQGGPPIVTFECRDVLEPILWEQLKMVANRPAAEIGALRGELENRAERMEEGLAGATSLIAMEVARLGRDASFGPLRLGPIEAQRVIRSGDDDKGTAELLTAPTGIQ